jgi:hypothetical protein
MMMMQGHTERVENFARVIDFKCDRCGKVVVHPLARLNDPPLCHHADLTPVDVEEAVRTAVAAKQREIDRLREALQGLREDRNVPSYLRLWAKTLLESSP